MVTTADRHATLTDMDWGRGVTGRLAGVSEIADILGCSRARADQLSRQQGFPEPWDTLGVRHFRDPDDVAPDEEAKEPRPQRLWLAEDIYGWHRDNPKIGRRDPKEKP